MHEHEKKIIAEAIVYASYGTDVYDRVNEECYHARYADIKKVLMNEEYWNQYESDMSQPLANDFNLPFGFETYRLTVYDNGEKHYKEVDENA